MLYSRFSLHHIVHTSVPYSLSIFNCVSKKRFLIIKADFSRINTPKLKNVMHVNNKNDWGRRRIHWGRIQWIHIGSVGRFPLLGRRECRKMCTTDVEFHQRGEPHRLDRNVSHRWAVKMLPNTLDAKKWCLGWLMNIHFCHFSRTSSFIGLV